jgi:hypothetical protein
MTLQSTERIRDEGAVFSGPVEEAISNLIDAGATVRRASEEMNRRLATVPPHLVRSPRVMVGFLVVGDEPVPQFAATPDEVNATMDRWEAALRASDGNETDVRSARHIRGLLLGNLQADTERLAQVSTRHGIADAVDQHNEALAIQQAAAITLNQSRPRTLADANALATFLAGAARDNSDPATYGAVAVNLQRCLAEIHTGKPQRPLLDS